MDEKKNHVASLEDPSSESAVRRVSCDEQCPFLGVVLRFFAVGTRYIARNVVYRLSHWRGARAYRDDGSLSLNSRSHLSAE